MPAALDSGLTTLRRFFYEAPVVVVVRLVVDRRRHGQRGLLSLPAPWMPSPLSSLLVAVRIATT
jgi:hypothetical protein